MGSKKSARVVIPVTIYCKHADEDSAIFHVMRISVLDKEVPSYEAKCPVCGKAVTFDFNGELS